MELIRQIRQVPQLEVMVGGPDVVYVDTRDRKFVDWIVNGYRFQVKQVEDVTLITQRSVNIACN